LGYNAGYYNLGKYSIAIGYNAGANNTSTASNISINATGAELNNTIANSCRIKPIRVISPTPTTGSDYQLRWNSGTGEIYAVALV
jgi:hypothetical protein